MPWGNVFQLFSEFYDISWDCVTLKLGQQFIPDHIGFVQELGLTASREAHRAFCAESIVKYLGYELPPDFVESQLAEPEPGKRYAIGSELSPHLQVSLIDASL